MTGVPIKLAGIDIGSRSIEFVLLNGDNNYDVIERFQAAPPSISHRNYA